MLINMVHTGPSLEPEYNMDTSSVHFQRGTFAAEQNLYQESLRERLPEDVETVSSIVNTRSALRHVSQPFLSRSQSLYSICVLQPDLYHCIIH